MRIFPSIALCSLGLLLGAPALAPTYTSPVIDHNFPDPFVLRDGLVYYAYATNSQSFVSAPRSPAPHANMACAMSADLVHWAPLPDALPVLPQWALPGRTWAPCVCTGGPGGSGFVAYFSARNRATNHESVGVATALHASGPFSVPPHTEADSAPLVEQTDEGGAIDPSVFTDDDGSRYLLWKNDGNSRARDTWLWLQALSPDGLHLTGQPTRLLKQDLPWEGNVVEAPTLWKHGSKYYLFYSANSYTDCRYAIGYAVADHLRGPYHKASAQPWLASSADFCGPGGEAIVRTRDGGEWMVYHTWVHGPRSYRGMSLAALTWNTDGPHLRVPMPAPAADGGAGHSAQAVPIGEPHVP